MRFFLSGLVFGFFFVVVAPASESHARTLVAKRDVPRGTILIDTSKRRLYLGVGRGKAMVYRVAVGKAGRQWTGTKRIRSKRKKPAWSPTAIIRRDKPNLPKVIPGGHPSNPMGAAALLLSGDGQYAIHGTNNPGSIGRFASYGCIRMHNRDVLDLYARVRLGTRVKVVR